MILSKYNFIFVQKRREETTVCDKSESSQGNITQPVSPDETTVVRLLSSYFVKVKSK